MVCATVSAYLVGKINTMIPLSLYIHFPWCIQKCPYCDFNSHQNNEKLYQPYMETLIEDLVEILPYIWGRKIHSIFIGGGTPSLIPPELLDLLFSKLRRYLNFSPTIEITLEANPGTVDNTYFQAYHEIGINRLSIGIQSLNDKHLEKIGRIHNTDEAIRAVDIAKKSGFKEINCDVMFGLPNQTVEEAIDDISKVIVLDPTHISHYQLTLEPNTYFHRYRPNLPNDDQIEEMQLTSYKLLAAAGFQQYEVSAFAKVGSESKHNTNYWEFGDYIGIGAGAHGKITMMGEQKIIRTQIEKHPRSYIEKRSNERLIFTNVSQHELPFEFFLNILRLKSGVPFKYWQERTFLSHDVIQNRIKRLQIDGLLEQDLNQIKATDRGFLFANSILEKFL